MDQLPKLIKNCKRGKASAQAELYRIFSPKLFAICLRYSRDYTEAEDNLQEGFIRIFSKIDQYTGSGSFEGWLCRIVVNVSLEKYRKNSLLYTVEDITIYESKSWNEEIISSLNANELMSLIHKLPDRYRLVFNLYAIEGFSHKEIAEQLGISEGTSKSNLSRARGILQKKVEKLHSEVKDVNRRKIYV